jgi:drug/metabolite transporter (DMT)-like permease
VAFAVLWGVVIFQEVPSAVGAAGMFLIVFAGILAVRSKAKCIAPPDKGLQSGPAKLER